MEETNSEIFLRTCTKHEDIGSIQSPRGNTRGDWYSDILMFKYPIIARNTTCTQEHASLKIIIYYKNIKTSMLLIKNNLNKNSDLKATNVIYKFTCPNEEYSLRPNVNYIGNTITTLSRRLTMHLNNGAIKYHMATTHNSVLNRELLVDNTKIIKRNADVNRLQISEAVIIKLTNPTINRQDTGITRTLKLFSDDRSNHESNLSNIQNIRATPQERQINSVIE